MRGDLPEANTVCDVIRKPFPDSGLRTVDEDAQFLLADMSQEDKDVFIAIQELSKTQIIPLPFFPGIGGNANRLCV